MRSGFQHRLMLALVGLILPVARAADAVQPEVQNDWAYQYRIMGSPYREHDRKNWHRMFTGVHLLQNDRHAPVEEPYLLDRHAAFWPEDRD